MSNDQRAPASAAAPSQAEAPSERALLQKAHDQLHRLVTTFVPGNDGAYAETTALMAELRALAAAPAPAAREVQQDTTESLAAEARLLAVECLKPGFELTRVDRLLERIAAPSPSAAEPGAILTAFATKLKESVATSPGFIEQRVGFMCEIDKVLAQCLLAQPSVSAGAAEPVAEVIYPHAGGGQPPVIRWLAMPDMGTKLYAHPPAERTAAREGMTEEQALQLATEKFPHWQIDIQERFVIELIRAAEAFHGIAAPAGGGA